MLLNNHKNEYAKNKHAPLKNPYDACLMYKYKVDIRPIYQL